MFRLSEQRTFDFDCLILGAGITGAGVARDAAMRGLSTLIVDSQDFASGTSHLSSKLVHGGFRYLEHLRFRLVWEGIAERERLMRHLAPHLLRPLKFILPFRKDQWLKWLLAVGASYAYGLPQRLRYGRRSSAFLRGQLQRAYPWFAGPPLGVAFWDAQTNDARLVLSALRAAEACGAVLCNYTQVLRADWVGDAWEVVLRREEDSWERTIRAKTLTNATGPWSPITATLLKADPPETKWVKGSHLLLRRHPRFGDDAIIIRSVRDGRPLWVVPWEQRLIVGSTESTYAGDLRDVRPTADEVADLFLSVIEAFPSLGLTRDDICSAYAGVRPIVDQASCSENRMSRRHNIHVDSDRRLITVSGGKLTTFRRMAEQTVDEIEHLLDRPAAANELRHRLRSHALWPALSPKDVDALVIRLAKQVRNLEVQPLVLNHIAKLYGYDAHSIVDGITINPDWGNPIAEGLPYCIAELAYLCKHERVRHLTDLVKRRTPIYFLVDDCGINFLPSILDQLAPILGWSEKRIEQELDMLVRELNQDLAALGREVPPLGTALQLVACA